MELEKIKNVGLKTRKGLKMQRPFLAGCVVGNELYFASWLDNGFYKLDIKTGQYVLLNKFENETESLLMYDQALYYNGELWLIPYHAENIAKINLQTLEIVYISLPQKGKDILNREGERIWRFRCCYLSGKSEFWLAPIGYNLLLRVNMLDNSIESFEASENGIIFKNGITNFMDACFVDDEIWFCPYDEENLVIFNTLTAKFSLHKWNYAKEEFGMIKSYKNWVLFIPQKFCKYILMVNKDTYEEKRIPLNVSCANTDGLMYRIGDIVGTYLLLAPFLAHEYIAINLENGQVQINKDLHQYSKKMNWKPERYQASFKVGTKIIYVSDESLNPLMIYDFEENVVFYQHLYMDLKSLEEFIFKLYNQDKQKLLNWIHNFHGGYQEKQMPLSLYPEVLEMLSYVEDQDNKNFFGQEIFSYLKERMGDRK